MTGLRLTVRRPVGGVFAEHPLPWTHIVCMQSGSMRITDENGRTVVESCVSFTVAQWVYEMYCYCFYPEMLPSPTTSVIRGHAVPRVVQAYNFPWELREEGEVGHDGPLPMTLRDADGDILKYVGTYDVDLRRELHILFELAQFAENTHYKFWRSPHART
jgi:hypothetical protein